MLDQAELNQLAHLVETLRPDWKWTTVYKLLHANHTHRDFRQAAMTLTWIATDPAGIIGNVKESPWWEVDHTPTHDDEPEYVYKKDRCQKPGHQSYLAQNCGACRSEQIEDAGKWKREWFEKGSGERKVSS
ncbi:MAG: hypothetical protein FWF90_17475 [Promicromonosporaceae bacterium]|nr:hypothetical protein [Promicromonosporaceae bacterium]